MELSGKIQAKNKVGVLEMNAIKSLEPFTFAYSKLAVTFKKIEIGCLFKTILSNSSRTCRLSEVVNFYKCII